jgi:hypothetical protein
MIRIDTPEHLGRAGASAPQAPNTAFVYLCVDSAGNHSVHRVVARGVCTVGHEERVSRSLSAGRYFLPGLVAQVMPSSEDDGPMAGCCELVAITPTLAEPTGDGDVEAVVTQFEAAAMHGWNPRHDAEESAQPA